MADGPQPYLATTAHPARMAIFLSGSGSNAERILQQWQAAEAPPFEVVTLVTDRPERSRAFEIGRAFDLPVIANDIREFYRSGGCTRVTLATAEGRSLREKWTDALRRQLADYRIDFGVFAGFIPLTNITGDFPCLNVHPGDLTYLKGGERYLVGLHTVPIERAILEGLDHLRTSVIIAEKGKRITSIAARCPTASSNNARGRANARCSIKAADTASGQPMPGFTP